jgi:hypothetical protein
MTSTPEQVGLPDDDLPRPGVDADDIARLAVEGAPVQPEAASLTDGEPVGAGMPSEDRPAHRVDDLPGRLPQPAGEPSAGVPVRNEADVMTVRFAGYGEPARGRLGPDLVLGRPTEREERTGKLIRIEHPEYVGLVLGGVDRSMQFAAGGSLDDLGVVPGRDRVEPERDRLVEQGRELDPLVAPQARVRGPPGGVLGDEVLDDLGLEPLGQVPHIERDPESIRDPAGITGVLDGAAPTGRLAQCRRGPGQRQVDADGLVTGLENAGRRHRRIDPAAHRDDDPHRDTPAARRAC